GGTAKKAEAGNHSIDFGDVRFTCAEVVALTNRVRNQQRSVQYLLDAFEKEQNASLRSGYAAKIRENEDGIVDQTKPLLPAAQSCQNSLSSGLDELTRKRVERDKIDRDGVIAKLKKELGEQKNDKTLDRELTK